MDWLSLSVLSALFWGVGQVFLKKGFENISPLWNNIIVTIFYFLFFIPVSLISGVNFNINIQVLGIILLISLLYINYYYSIEKGPVSLTGTLIATYPAVTSLLSVIFLREQLSFLQTSMIILIIMGGILLGYGGYSQLNFRNKWLIFGITASLGMGMADFLVKVTLQQIDVNTYNFFFPIAYLVGTLILSAFDKRGRKSPKINNISAWKYTLLGICIIESGQFTFNHAISAGQASLVAPVSSTYSAITVILALLFLKEKVSGRQLGGIFLMILGTVFIGL